MEVSRPNDTAILLARIDPLLADFLRRIPVSADPGDNKAARERLFSAPTHDPEEDTFSEDWRDYVEPELAALFQSAIQLIEADLQKLHTDSKTGEATVSIPSEHLEGWIHGLKQARLVMTERHNIREKDLERAPSLAGDARSLLLLQLHFYAELQVLFLRLLEGR